MSLLICLYWPKLKANDKFAIIYLLAKQEKKTDEVCPPTMGVSLRLSIHVSQVAYSNLLFQWGFLKYFRCFFHPIHLTRNTYDLMNWCRKLRRNNVNNLNYFGVTRGHLSIFIFTAFSCEIMYFKLITITFAVIFH